MTEHRILPNASAFELFKTTNNLEIQKMQKMRYKNLASAVAMSLGVLLASPTLANGLMAHYPFDGNAQDMSGNENNGTVNGATLTQDRFGNANSAYSFDGVDDSIVVPSSPSLNPVDQLTIAFWIKINGITNVWSPIIYKAGPVYESGWSNREYTVWLHSTPSFFTSIAGVGGDQNQLFSSAVSSGEWVFYTVVMDRQTHLRKSYINGVLDTSLIPDSYSSFNNNTHDLVFGGRGEEGYSTISPLNGILDDIRLYNRALSDCEIKTLHTGRDECCLELCAVHDKGLNDSQFLIIGSSPGGLGTGVTMNGPLLLNHDIEALDTHPETKVIYAASGDNTPQKGYLYTVDECNGDNLALVGNIVDKNTGRDYKEVDALSFNPIDGTLWGWSQNDGLLKIDPNNAQATLVLASKGEIEDLTWDTTGTKLYGVQNLHDDPVDSHGAPDFEQGILWFYYDTTTGKIVEVCHDLTTQVERVEVEGLETLLNGWLVFGLHDKGAVTVVKVDPNTCQAEVDQVIADPPLDIEGLACMWPESEL